MASFLTMGMPNCKLAKKPIDLVILGTILDKIANDEAELAKEGFPGFIII